MTKFIKEFIKKRIKRHPPRPEPKDTAFNKCFYIPKRDKGQTEFNKFKSLPVKKKKYVTAITKKVKLDNFKNSIKEVVKK